MTTAIQHHAMPQRAAPNPWHFDFSVIDDAAHQSELFALRYEVYCNERKFLTAGNYPTRLEMDPYDDHAIHVGGTDQHGQIIGTVRLVLPSPVGFPLFEHCRLYPQFQYLADRDRHQTAAEISRLAVSKGYRRREKDGYYDHHYRPDRDVAGAGERRSSSHTQDEDAIPHRRLRPEIVLGIYRTMYQVTKRQGITHWFAAMEKSLLRLLRRYNVTFTAIGPELDYYGPVTPYIAEVAEIERAIFQRCPEIFREFIQGLEPELVPEYAR